MTKAPGIPEKLAQEVARAMQVIRQKVSLKKKPSIAETLDWARALEALGVSKLDSGVVEKTLNVILKDRQDQETFQEQLGAQGLCRALAEQGG